LTNTDLLYSVEPWATRVYVDNWDCAEQYIAKEQPTSKIDLRTRIFKQEDIEQHQNDVLLEFSQNDFMTNINDNMRIIINLSDMLSDGVENDSMFECGIYQLKTGTLKDISETRIKYKI
jgi:hypothetical protein